MTVQFAHTATGKSSWFAGAPEIDLQSYTRVRTPNSVGVNEAGSVTPAVTAGTPDIFAGNFFAGAGGNFNSVSYMGLEGGNVNTMRTWCWRGRLVLATDTGDDRTSTQFRLGLSDGFLTNPTNAIVMAWVDTGSKMRAQVRQEIGGTQTIIAGDLLNGDGGLPDIDFRSLTEWDFECECVDTGSQYDLDMKIAAAGNTPASVLTAAITGQAYTDLAAATMVRTGVTFFQTSRFVKNGLTNLSLDDLGAAPPTPAAPRRRRVAFIGG
ncbi:MAG: hypothetical protein AAFR11_05670 [Pseudomonadota bacterium]